MYLYLYFILWVIFVVSSCICICVSYYQSYLSSHRVFIFVFHIISHICPLIIYLYLYFILLVIFVLSFCICISYLIMYLYLYFISHHVFVFVFHIIGHICPLITRLLMWKLWAALGQPLSGGYFIPAHHTHRYTNTNTKHTPIQNIHKYKTYMSTNSNTNTDQIQNGNRNTNILADVYSNTDTDPTQMLISDKCIVWLKVKRQTILALMMIMSGMMGGLAAPAEAAVVRNLDDGGELLPFCISSKTIIQIPVI